MSVYPDTFKRAEVAPIYKKNDFLIRSNYRPVSVLTATSKVVESLMSDQINTFFNDILSVHLSAYRKHYSCNNVLLKCIEDWRAALDKNETVACVMMDLSKAFDSLPHGLLIAKLNAYGFSAQSCTFIQSYLSNREQRVKLGSKHSSWECLKRGVPQGSILGPLLFNIFLNDLFYTCNSVAIFNYADDNSLSYHHTDPLVVKNVLENSCEIAIKWFKDNRMQANPDKFQAITLSRNSSNQIPHFNVNGIEIIPEQTAKLLGIHLDDKLNFDEHISTLCLRAAQQINAFYRISPMLSNSGKLKVYDAFILSNFNYCPIVWHNCGLLNTRKVEKMNKRALKVVFGDRTSSYKDLLSKSDRPMLYAHQEAYGCSDF